MKPSIHCIPGHILDPGDSRFPDAVYGHGSDIIEAGARTLQTVVCGPISRREGSITVPTTVSSPPSLTGFVEGMTDFEILGAGVFTSGYCDVEIFVLSGKVGFLSKDFSGQTRFGGIVLRRIPRRFSWIP